MRAKTKYTESMSKRSGEWRGAKPVGEETHGDRRRWMAWRGSGRRGGEVEGEEEGEGRKREGASRCGVGMAVGFTRRSSRFAHA
jgi:hypothetical protein